MKKAGLLVMLFSLLFFQPDVSAQKERADIEDQYKWDLTDLYASDDAWKAKKDEAAAQFDKVLEFKGKLGSSSSALFECLKFDSDLTRELVRLYIYASQKSDLDTRESGPQAMKQQMQQLFTDYGAKASFVDPEILEIDAATIDKFITEEKGLKVYEFYLKDLQRKKEHRLSEKEEKILANAGLITGESSNIYGILTNADLPYPEVELTDGTKATLSSAGYAKHRASTNRADRELVFNEFFGALKQFSRTLGSTMSANIKSHLFAARSRNYDTCLEAALDANNIPTDVYMSLVENVNKNLDSFHRYLDIKRRMLGVDTLKYIDMYAPTVDGVDLKYSIDEAYDIVSEALAPLGKEYVGTIETAANNRWIDVYPTTGKRSGAYSSGNAYDVHPYILMNYNGKYDDVSTLTHELGHTMHSYFSNAAQPWIRSHYTIFVAEVASTFNEALLIDHMLKTIDDDAVRLSLLGHELEGMKGTVFRQTQFAEFELRMHERTEQGEALTGDDFSAMYQEIVRTAYGHADRICVVDDEIKGEWAYIPHFYYNFYVYQYATSYTASSLLAERVLNGDRDATMRYRDLLASGGSEYPIEQLRKAGVDMTSDEPLAATMRRMNRIMDEIETLLNRMER